MHAYGGDGHDTLKGGAARDYLYGDDGNDTIYAGDGRDYVLGDNGFDYLNGGSGNDAFFAEYGYDFGFFFTVEEELIADISAGDRILQGRA